MSETPTPRRRRQEYRAQMAAQQEASVQPAAPQNTPRFIGDTPKKRPELPPSAHRPEQTGSAERRRKAMTQGGKHRRKRRALLPPFVRLLLVTLLSAALVTGVVVITRSYLAQQEERRRLEAEAAERAQHPLYFESTIRENAALQGLDPALVSAVILCESSYDTKAESRLGARGLMQLMEDTAAWVAHKLGEDDENYSFDLLYDGETNIRFGCWYLGYLSRRFGGDPLKIVCAYHAGQGNVDSWLSNPDYSHDGKTLDVVPTSDTAAYSDRVLRARDVYVKYYFPELAPIQTGDAV